MSRVAAIQMTSGQCVQTNLRQAKQLITQAAEQGAGLVVLPENFALLGADVYETGQQEARLEAGSIRVWLSQMARQLGLWIVAGSIPLANRRDGHCLDNRVRSVCLVLDDRGAEVARYDKIHLFDVEVGDEYGSYRESDTVEPGERVVVIDTPYGKLGLAICYDLRFPELFQLLRQQGAEIITLPSAFTAKTGAAHWEVLLRARAIENQCYLLGINQTGWHTATRQSHGHTMIVDPWGKILAEQAEGSGVVLAEVDLLYLADVRQRMPIAQHKRLPATAKPASV